MENLNQILQLPERTLVNKKITKAFFKRNFDLTLSERKLLDDPQIIQHIEWVASLKPQNCNIPAYIDVVSTYEEIQIISVLVDDTAFDKFRNKVAELIQKYIPYHVFMLITSKTEGLINAAEKKVNQNDVNKRSVEKTLSSECMVWDKITPAQCAFLSSCAYDKLDKQDLRALYLSWIGNIVALKAAEHTGEYQVRPLARTQSDVKLLEEITAIEAEIERLHSASKKETQLSIQVQINSEVQIKRMKLQSLKQNLHNKVI